MTNYRTRWWVQQERRQRRQELALNVGSALVLVAACVVAFWVVGWVR